MRALLPFFFALAGFILPARAAPPARTEVPIRLVTLSDGARRFAVPATVDGVAIEVGLDTGSTGLRVMDWALPAGGHGPREDYRYSSGVRIEGPVSHMKLAIGNLVDDVPVQRIDRIGCSDGHAGCAGERLAITDFRLQGDGLKGEGFPAIFGIDMGSAGAVNPLVAMHVSRWIIEMPLPGSAAPGRLILNPDDSEVAGYRTYSIMPQFSAAHGGIHDALPGCLVRTDTKAKLCGPVLFDTGAPGLRISLPDAGAMWPDGTPGVLAIGDGQSAIAFTVGRRDQASGMFVEHPGTSTAPLISAGLMPYFGWSVLYDAQHGVIGLKPR